MGYKYCCDDCGAELGKSDNVASQLDMTGHAYCCKCYPKHEEERKPKSWVYTSKEKMHRIFDGTGTSDHLGGINGQ